MKKILSACIVFCIIFSNLQFSLHPVYAVAQISGPVSSNPVPLPISLGVDLDITGVFEQYYKFVTDNFPKRLNSIDQFQSAIWDIAAFPSRWLADKLNSYLDDDGKLDTFKEGCPVSTDGTYIYIDNDFMTELNEQVQDNVYRLNGYYLIEPQYPLSVEGLRNRYSGYFFTWSSDSLSNFESFSAEFPSCFIARDASGGTFSGLPVGHDYHLYLSPASYVKFYKQVETEKVKRLSFSSSSFYLSHLKDVNPLSILFSNLVKNNPSQTDYTLFGLPVKIFYSKADWEKYNESGRSSYAPDLSGSKFKIPVDFFLPNGTINPAYTGLLGGLSVNLPNNPSETNIQDALNEFAKNFMNSLASVTPAPTATPKPTSTPTPKPKPTATPIPVTPTPIIPDATITPSPPPEDFSSVNNWLERIYNWLLDFGNKHSTFEKTLSQYLESSNSKLDQIITALDKISQGDTTGTETGCKYDYTELSTFLTTLWNESDKKLDTMAELLQKNNEYLQTLVDSLPPTEDYSSITERLDNISNWLSSFGTKHDSFEKTLSQYLESSNGKLEQIIEAIDKIPKGDTTGTINGCKYDYSELSSFMSNLWNESDKKFDTMIELLQENNKYQEKLVDSLNQIKALLIADTVMDVFKNRSSETANKAKEKFPTSLPWDVAMVVNAMCADPKEPVIELPIEINSLNIKEKITVDLSSSEWEKLAKTCRYLLSILFVLYLIHLTRKFFNNKGDD